jgi:predicted lipoprotein
MASTGGTNLAKPRTMRRQLIIGAGIAALIAAMAFDTTVVHVGSTEDLRVQGFDPDRFGQAEFPRIRALVLDRAVDAATLAEALETDRNAAIAEFGTMAGAFPVMPVFFTGTLGEGRSGIFPVTVEGLPDSVTLRVQTGPAINGTELRDIAGDISFGDFTNQIEYQNAGAGINRAMSADILSNLDRDALEGATVTVTGAFTMINPASWLITPVTLEVQ